MKRLGFKGEVACERRAEKETMAVRESVRKAWSEMSSLAPGRLFVSEVLSLLTSAPAVALAVLLLAGAGASASARDDLVTPMPSAVLPDDVALNRIAFGSCAKTENSQSVWNQIRAQQPDAFLFTGDNVYGPTNPGRDLSGLAEQYRRLARSQPFAALRAEVPVLTTWDDHDFGPNDSGGDFVLKQASEALFNLAWAVPDDDPRRAREGVYSARGIGPPGRRVQLIMLDTRYFRSPLKAVPAGSPGRYAARTDAAATMLGEAQWLWLRQQLMQPADLRVVASSIQVLADGHGWEGWHTMPQERDRLFALIRATRANGVVLISGDRHLGAIYTRDDLLDYPIWEFTSSSLNAPLPAYVAERVEPGPHRLGPPLYSTNYGLIDIDWDAGTVSVTVVDDQDRVARGKVLWLQDLTFR